MDEGPGILRWSIDGCLDWQANGLVRSATVMDATKDYFDSQDLFGQWLDEECDAEPGNEFKTATAADLFESWSKFAKNAGEAAGTGKAFGGRLAKKFIRGREGHSNVRVWKGIRLKRLAPNSAGD